MVLMSLTATVAFDSGLAPPGRRRRRALPPRHRRARAARRRGQRALAARAAAGGDRLLRLDHAPDVRADEGLGARPRRGRGRLRPAGLAAGGARSSCTSSGRSTPSRSSGSRRSPRPVRCGGRSRAPSPSRSGSSNRRRRRRSVRRRCGSGRGVAMRIDCSWVPASTITVSSVRDAWSTIAASPARAAERRHGAELEHRVRPRELLLACEARGRPATDQRANLVQVEARGRRNDDAYEAVVADEDDRLPDLVLGGSECRRLVRGASRCGGARSARTWPRAPRRAALRGLRRSLLSPSRRWTAAIVASARRTLSSGHPLSARAVFSGRASRRRPGRSARRRPARWDA